MTKGPSDSSSGDPFDSPPEAVREEFFSVECPAIVTDRWGFEPAERFVIRVAVLDDLSIEVTRSDRNGPVNQHILDNPVVTDAMDRLLKAVRREHTSRIAHRQAPGGSSSLDDRPSIPAVHSDMRHRSGRQGLEEEHRQKASASDPWVHIQRLSDEQHAKHSPARQSDSLRDSPFHGDIIFQYQPQKLESTTIGKDALVRMSRPSA